MTPPWSPEELERVGSADELQIAVKRADGTLRRWTPIWVVRVGEQVYVRTWSRRESGWFGHVLHSRRARIRVPGLEVDVAVEDVGEATAQLRARIDAAYRTKYRRYGSSSVEPMVAVAAAAATLQLSPEREAPPSQY
jgi:hypothetical protein